MNKILLFTLEVLSVISLSASVVLFVNMEINSGLMMFLVGLIFKIGTGDV